MSITQFVHGQILHGDVLEKLKEIPAESIDCVITSPAYWGLRDYKVEGQWGLEKDFHEYLEKMQQFMALIKIVLKNTGSCWINLGDTYSAKPVGSFNQGGKEFEDRDMSGIESSGQLDKTGLGVNEKSLMLIPWEFAVNCRDNGWTIRNIIPWIKENAMPSSVRDRFTNKWEPIFFMTKARKYYFNLDAVRVKPKGETKPFNLRIRDAKKGLGKAKMGDLPQAWKMSKQEDLDYNEKGERKYSELPNSNTSRLGQYRDEQRKQDATIGADGKPLANYKGFNDRWSKKTRKHYDDSGNCLGCGKPASQHTVTSRAQGSENRDERQKDAIVWCNPKGKNPGDIFRINPKPFSEAHFATFPIELPLKILKCACPKNGIVLDPFFGSGTVGVAAEMLGLNWKGIELSEEYVKMAKERLEPHNFSRLDDFFT